MVWIEDALSYILNVLGEGRPSTLAALFSITLLAEVGVPFPFIPDSALFLAGYHNGFNIRALYPFLAVFFARQTGASLAFHLSHLLGHNVLSWLSRRFPRLYQRINEVLLNLNNRHIPVAIAFLRLSGLFYIPSIVAGVLKLPFRYLIAGVALSSLILDGASILLGMLAKHGFRILGFTPTNWSVVVGFIIIMLIVLLLQYLLARRKKSKKAAVKVKHKKNQSSQ